MANRHRLSFALVRHYLAMLLACSAAATGADEPTERATLPIDVRIPHGATWIAVVLVDTHLFY